jgi:beta-galactosidase
MRTDRQEISADAEDVVVCAIEVQDAQGRVVPITDNEVSFKVTGPGKVIGVGNGDPTSHESDIGSTRKAFSGLCMAIVQSAKSAGTIRVDATSPGLTAASATVAAKAVQLRPQASVWERAVPAGPGITGLWRPTAAIAAPATGNPMALGGGSTDMVFTFRQDGNALTGSVEAAGGGGFGGGGSTGGAIEEGKVEGDKISFRVGNTTYTGTVKGEQIELQRSAPAGRGGRGGAGAPAAPAAAGPRPAVGPAATGSDPSFGAGGGRGGGQAPAPMILRRVTR